VRYASLDVIKDALGKGQGWRRHLPPAILLVALGAMIAAMARPAALITLPSQHETVILAIDVSASMRADDVQPTRIVAAQAAAREFVAGQARSTRIGVVSFAGSAALVQPPTQNRTDILAAIDALQLQHATAVGSGIQVALKAIFPEEEFEVPASGRQVIAMRPGREPPRQKAVPVAPGSYGSAAIILLTDGQTTTGPDPVDVARLAAQAAACAYSPSASARPTARSSPAKAGRCASSWTRSPSRSSPTSRAPSTSTPAPRWTCARSTRR
jgi:Ca-activated chloride channel family protein